MKTRNSTAAAVLAACLGVAGCGLFSATYQPPPPPAPPLPADVKAIPQGSSWDDANRWAFYTLDQGSRLMPLAWFKALKRADGKGFVDDQLARWGYLARDSSDNLPVGFAVGQWDNQTYVGMTCAACHTRQIRVDGKLYRIDGGPALTDLYGFFVEIDEAVQRTLASDPAFDDFSAQVLAPKPSVEAKAKLRHDLETFAGTYHAIATGGLKGAPPWGLGLADAVSMIFNRVGGLDIGDRQDNYLVRGNIKPADAPVRYPFLWNAPVQDKTQWAGFAPNGNPLFSLTRNLGEVYGVFGVLHPEKAPLLAEKVNLIKVNSAEFANLDRLEQLVERIGRPQWIWPVDQALVSRGKTVFEEVKDARGTSCAECHGIQRKWTFGLWPLFTINWKTPVQDVGTDQRQYDVLARQSDSATLEGGQIPVMGTRIGQPAKVIDLLNISVAGAVLQKAEGLRQEDHDQFRTLASITTDNDRRNVSIAFKVPEQAANAPGGQGVDNGTHKYESRVMQGIWAAAPFLHNGSVPTLADLLKAPDQRPQSFVISADYDLDKVGLAATAGAGGLEWTYRTTGCEDHASGRSRCGHDFGTSLNDDDKRALLEYLKTL